MTHQLERIFDPQSIAVVGASADPAKRGHQILRALADSGYDGDVYAVNPRGGTILDNSIYTSVEELPDGVDLAVLCTPAPSAPALVRACGERGVGGVVVLAVGYGESGEAGRALEADLVAASQASGVRVIGPNTSGLLNLHRGVNLIGARGVRAGGLALLVQSGNVALSLMTEVTERSWDGVSICLGVGNQIDVGFTDAISYLETHEETHAVIVHVEGLRDARAFLASAARLARSKPIVAIKSGRTTEGAGAALSHTGSVAGPYDRFSAALAQAGVVEVARTDELLHVAETLGRQPACPPGQGILILSDGGGQGTLAADSLVESGAELATLSHDTAGELRRLLGSAAAVANPVDLAGAADTDPTLFASALETVVRDPSVGTVLVIGLFGGYGIRFSEELTSAEITTGTRMAHAVRSAEKGLVVHSMYAGHRSAPLAALGTEGVPVVGSLEVACRCANELQRRGRTLARPMWSIGLEDPPTDPGIPPHVVIDRARSEGRSILTEPEARELLSDAGLSFGRSTVVDSPGAAREAMSLFSEPVAAKLVSSVITHKSDAGGVVLGVDTPDDAAVAFRTIQARVSSYAAENDLEAGPIRMMLTPVLPPPRLELLLGGYRDPDLGPVLTMGAGGIWVEALRDVGHLVLPVDDLALDALLDGLTIARLLDGGRGNPPIDRRQIVSGARAIADALLRWPDIAEVEVNPLFVYQDEAVPVDARVVLQHQRLRPSNRT